MSIDDDEDYNDDDDAADDDDHYDGDDDDDDVDLCALTITGVSWSSQLGTRLSNAAVTVRIITYRELDCSMSCMNSEAAPQPPPTPVDCDSFNYNPTTNICELNTHSLINTTLSFTADNSWVFWLPTFLVE